VNIEHGVKETRQLSGGRLSLVLSTLATVKQSNQHNICFYILCTLPVLFYSDAVSS